MWLMAEIAVGVVLGLLLYELVRGIVWSHAISTEEWLRRHPEEFERVGMRVPESPVVEDL